MNKSINTNIEAEIKRVIFNKTIIQCIKKVPLTINYCQFHRMTLGSVIASS
jgi:hypothetical protein